jgi:glycosyltransferase involved in cell wall biosynthesis
MRVTTSCPGRFWIFDQARELDRAGALHRLVTTSPRWQTRRWGIPDDKVTSLWLRGGMDRAIGKIAGRVGPERRCRLVESLHDRFSRSLPGRTPDDSDVFIGLSSLSLEGLLSARQRGVLACVDHASMHEASEREIVREEARRWGLESAEEWPYDWVVEKEQAEFEAADVVFAPSQVTRRSLVANGVADEKIFVNPCGVDLRSFGPGRKEDDVFRVIQVGGIIARKGVQYLMQAFTELDLPRSELWLIGAGAESSSLRPVLDRFASDRVHLKGTVDQGELREMYAHCSVAVLASVADGFGLVVPQAMACGLPVIVTENVGAADIVVPGETGFVIPIRDVEALKTRLLELYEDPDRARRMGSAAAESVRRGHTWEDYGDRLVSFLSTATAGRG